MKQVIFILKTGLACSIWPMKSKYNSMKNIILIAVLILSSLMYTSCNDLDEELYGKLSPENYYQTEEEALSSVVAVYQRLSDIVNIGAGWRPSVLGTDEFFVPARTNGGWYDGGIWIEYAHHDVTPSNELNRRAWNSIFPTIGAANLVIESIESSPKVDELTALVAETRALRAYAYFYAMDFWGNVPLVIDARIDPSNTPSTTSRSEIFEFVVTELKEAASQLPSVKDVSRTDYYPRFTKEAVYTALATVYLNAEVYSGSAQWSDVVEMCDNVINTNAYSLEAKVGDCFLATNEENSTEIISSFSIDPNQNAGRNQFMLYTNHALDKEKYDLPFTPADGYSLPEEALNRYEDGDERKELIEYGPQYYLNGDPLLKEDGTQLVITPVQDIYAAENDEGYHLLKYSPIGVTWQAYNADNDLVLQRYADVLLMKAEALFRTGNTGDALDLVNEVRERSNATQLDVLTIQDIEDERAREFIWEGSRRRDMIRFGSYFSDTWTFKTTQTEEWRGIYPIPEEALNANPQLDQNPGY